MTLPAAELPVGVGWLSLSPLPGRGGDLAGDVAGLVRWQADLVVSLTEAAEMTTGDLPGVLAAAGIGWRHVPVPDYGVPGDVAGGIEELSALLAGGRRIALHCMGGCGRSGMLALRLMVQAGEAPADALARLRAVRPCAVETPAQLDWAVSADQAKRPGA
ncbi:protein phosphatase [Gemmobacter sp.]|uniref:phosphatase domain-containing putative toxin n=1 Tax=Gemmobacter sp. TaxID=1898957 RepID=UPI002AFE94D0|nr:protein phosphatase [Gemmobacter sp.]